MKWFHDLKISAKLIAGFLVVALIAGVVGIIGLTNILSISDADTMMYQQNTLGIKYSGDAAAYFQRVRYNLAEMILKEDPSLANEYVKSSTSASTAWKPACRNTARALPKKKSKKSMTRRANSGKPGAPTLNRRWTMP